MPSLGNDRVSAVVQHEGLETEIRKCYGCMHGEEHNTHDFVLLVCAAITSEVTNYYTTSSSGLPIYSISITFHPVECWLVDCRTHYDANHASIIIDWLNRAKVKGTMWWHQGETKHIQV